MLAYGDMRELTDEELARAVQLDPSQIAGLGPSLEALMEMLRERKQKILETYETERVQARGRPGVPRPGQADEAARRHLEERFRQAVDEEQLYDLERLWYRAGDEREPVRPAVGAAGRPAGRQVSGRRAGGQVRVHRPHADDDPQGAGGQGGAGGDRPAAEAAGRGGQDGPDRRDRPGGPGRVRRAGRHREAQRVGPADRSSISATWPSSRGWRTAAAATSSRPRPIACSKAGCWSGSSAIWKPSRTGRHQGPIVGEGAVEMQQTKPYEFGDSLANMDMSRLAGQRHDPRRAGPAGRHASRRTSKSIARATRPSAPRWCCWT